MDGLVQAVAMGGYGGYVWAAFGFALIVMVALLWQSWQAQRRSTGELDQLRSTIRGTSRPRRRLVATRPASDARTAPDVSGAEQSASGP